jgi:hypothetical protein
MRQCIKCLETKELENFKRSDSNTNICKQCRYAAKAVWHNRLKSRGLCISCSKEPKLEHHNRCYGCWFRYMAGKHLNDPNMAEQLIKVFNAQNGLCIYTKQPLILGLNTSLDHIKPKSLYPEYNTIDNLQFVLTHVNTMKGTLSHEEFINLCKLISHIN